MKRKSHSKISSVTATHAHILLNTGDTLKIDLKELDFQPKVNDLVEVYQDNQQIFVLKISNHTKTLLYLIGSALLALLIIGSTFLFFHNRNESTQIATKQTSSHKSNSKSSHSSSSSSSSSSSYSSQSSETPVIDTTVEALRDMENNGELKTGQRYRFTAELFRQEDWAPYSGHFKALNSYYSIWVKASNASTSGVELQIMKSLTDGWSSGMKVTFTVKIMEDSEKFQFWVVTEAETSSSAPTPESTSQPQTTQTQGVNTSAILEWDYTSIAGTWRNANGQEITFTNKGITNGIIANSSISDNGVLNLSVKTGSTGYGIMIYPAGIPLPWFNSDTSQDRLLAGQGLPTNENEVFYRVSN